MRLKTFDHELDGFLLNINEGNLDDIILIFIFFGHQNTLLHFRNLLFKEPHIEPQGCLCEN